MPRGKLQRQAEQQHASMTPAALKVRCDKCGAAFASRNKLFRHVRFDHEEVGQWTASSNTPPVDRKRRLTVAYEDEHMAVLVKPQGMAVMGVASLGIGGEETVQNSDALLLACPTSSAYKKAVASHRLDRCTGGLLLCSKTLQAEVGLKGWLAEGAVDADAETEASEMAREASVEGSAVSSAATAAEEEVEAVSVTAASGLMKKRYRAIVAGRLPVGVADGKGKVAVPTIERPLVAVPAAGYTTTDVAAGEAIIGSLGNDPSLGELGEGRITIPLERGGVKECVTRYRVLAVTRSRQFGWLSTVDCSPVTGRRHQLRKHFALAGCPIVGDKLYCTAAQWPAAHILGAEGPAFNAEAAAEGPGGDDRGAWADCLTHSQCALSPPFFLWALELHVPPLNLEPLSMEGGGPMLLPSVPRCRLATVCPGGGVGGGDVRVCLPEPRFFGLFREMHQDEFVSAGREPDVNEMASS